jgi:hypothetical protein
MLNLFSSKRYVCYYVATKWKIYFTRLVFILSSWRIDLTWLLYTIEVAFTCRCLWSQVRVLLLELFLLRGLLKVAKYSSEKSLLIFGPTRRCIWRLITGRTLLLRRHTLCRRLFSFHLLFGCLLVYFFVWDLGWSSWNFSWVPNKW